jgi:two-component system, LytTR family, response regulator
MIRTIIVDDEPKNRKILRSLLDKFCPEVFVMHEAGSAKDALEVIALSKPELLFLDIEMPYGNGFDLLDQLMPVDFEIIFITAFDEYTLKAFKYSALDYLLKPVNIEELQAAVERAAKKINTKNINQHLSNLLQNLAPGKAAASKIAVPTNDSYIFVTMRDILRLEARGNYTVIYTADGTKHISSRNIKQYDELLPEKQFFRIHNSHIINLEHVRKYRRGRGGEVEMADGAVLEVATRRKDAFLALLGTK